MHLQGLGQLQSLSLGGTRITDAAVDKILPNCQIVY